MCHPPHLDSSYRQQIFKTRDFRISIGAIRKIFDNYITEKSLFCVCDGCDQPNTQHNLSPSQLAVHKHPLPSTILTPGQLPPLPEPTRIGDSETIHGSGAPEDSCHLSFRSERCSSLDQISRCLTTSSSCMLNEAELALHSSSRSFIRESRSASSGLVQIGCNV
ncbi:uncharacterized protein LAESUDRAFT_457280 [Laetiporus sulphureus 93-53]|uniref:Uncharacterized protein n=1 Tax=Laetiporus sulphureus 93-53 TaxID=1314785 RepID=A0A165BR62_9APHY|nr:uncharacterized protein LAESUDRAFT_457280 [Laetiporus sulphureus 93-53]KZT01503.1 hypothetical protein LAESUDRAFT_457280 [Laetiporus sulphureus 93-53]